MGEAARGGTRQYWVQEVIEEVCMVQLMLDILIYSAKNFKPQYNCNFDVDPQDSDLSCYASCPTFQ